MHTPPTDGAQYFPSDPQPKGAIEIGSEDDSDGSDGLYEHSEVSDGSGGGLASKLDGLSLATASSQRAPSFESPQAKRSSGLKKPGDIAEAASLEASTITKHIEVLNTLIQSTGDWNKVVVDEYCNEGSQIKKATQTILLASLKGAPNKIKGDSIKLAGPLSAILPLCPRLVSFAEFLGQF